MDSNVRPAMIDIQAIVSRYINKIEVIGHKKSLVIELRLYANGEEQYKELFNALSKLDLNNIAQMTLFAQSKLSAMGIDEKKIEQLEQKAKQ